MRIISMLVAMPLLLTAVVPQHKALAAETIITDEIKTNFNPQENILAISGISLDGKIIPMGVPIKYELDNVKKVTEKKNRAAKYMDNNADNILPGGKFPINASAYTAAADECGKSDGITASGSRVRENNTIACPANFPLGTKIKIDGYGTYICEDRGGAIRGNHIDIYMKTKREAFAFGRRNLLAEVVD